MSGSLNTSADITPTSGASCPVSLADGTTMLARCKQAILHHGGTWPPAGTKTTSGRSASPAIFSDKENSGYLARLSIASSREELLMLCNERGAIASTRARSLQTSQTTTDEPGKHWRRISGLSKGEAIQVYRLRHERLELLHWFEANGRGGKYHYSDWMWRKKEWRLKVVCRELVHLTANVAYLHQ